MGLLALVGTVALVATSRGDAPAPLLRAVGPRTVSNQTASPVALYGERFHAGMQVRLGAPLNTTLPVTVADPAHGYVRLPADLPVPAATTQVTVPVSIEGEAVDGEAGAPVTLTLVNDTSFPELIDLAVSASGRVLAISQTTDQLFSIDPATGAVSTAKTGDGPTAIAAYPGDDGQPRVLVAHRYSPELWSFPADLSAPPTKLAAPTNVSALRVADGVAYLAEQATDTVVALELTGGRVRWRAKVAPNPGALALAGGTLAVGSQGAGVIEAVSLATGEVQPPIQPGPDVRITGGRTEPYAKYVIGGKAVRGLAWSASLARLFVTSIGPNVGPNPDKMEVTLNPGVGVVDLAGKRFERHLGFNEGLDEGLAIDDGRGLLYLADIGLGRIRVVDARRLSLLQSLPIPAPARFPRVRPPADFTARTAGEEVHSGPVAVALSKDQGTLYVLDRFSGTLAVVDVRQAGQGHCTVEKQLPVVDTLAQRTRRQGQVLYFADLGRTGLTCEGCHLEGGAEGLFFAKTHPLRLYRAPTLRGVKDTPPYFTPASTHSLAETSRVVGNRNRFFRVRMSPREIDALTTYTGGVTLLPNPFLEPTGAPKASVPLPWGGQGAPERGEAVFHRLGCERCHAPPLFTLDQAGPSRGTYLDVGTPHALAIHPEWQEASNGAFAVQGGTLRIDTRWPLRAVLEKAPAPHATSSLTGAERDDLYAFLLSL
jgi:DNA-binding beta-propeller fold protein YncE